MLRNKQSEVMMWGGGRRSEGEKSREGERSPGRIRREERERGEGMREWREKWEKNWGERR